MKPCEAVKTDIHEKWGCTMIIYNPDNDNKFLVCKRAPGDRFQPNTWGLPGGKVELGESVEAAIVREVQEETGLVIYNYTYLGCYVEDGWTDFVFMSNAYTGQIKLDPAECSASRWVTLEEVDLGVSIHETMDIFKYTISTLKFYRDWRDVQILREMNKARQQIERQYP